MTRLVVVELFYWIIHEIQHRCSKHQGMTRAKVQGCVTPNRCICVSAIMNLEYDLPRYSIVTGIAQSSEKDGERRVNKLSNYCCQRTCPWSDRYD